MYKEVKKLGLEAMSLLTHAHSELNIHRCLLMKTDIGKVYAPLCSSDVPVTDFLFGDDLQKHLKDIGDQNKIGAAITSSRNTAGGHQMLAMVRVFTSGLGSGRQKTSRAGVQQSTGKTGKAEANPTSSDSSFFISPEFSG